MAGMVNMGFGNVAVGECRCPTTGARGIIYLPLAEARPYNSDCGDIYEPNSTVKADKILAGVYFHNEQVLDQTIEVLMWLKARFQEDKE